MKSQFIFLLIPGALMMAPLFFFALGFVSTFSLTHNKPEGEKMTVLEGLKFIGKRIVKLTPFNLFILGFGAVIGPTFGAGPFWNLFQQTMAPCNKYWWTNIAFISNFYPADFDAKCMGWSWFLPCYVQLSIALPFLILLFEHLPRIVSNIIFIALGVASMVVNFILIKKGDFGIFLTFDQGTHFNTKFLSELFMKPYFQFTSYLWGVVLCFAYIRYAREKSGLIPADVANNSLTSRGMAFIR